MDHLQEKRTMISKLLWHPNYITFQPEWDQEDIQTAFFKCIRWQVEETLDPTACPYHYYCDSTYPGNYPNAVDVSVLLFASASYLVTLVFMVMDTVSSRKGNGAFRGKLLQKYLLPSGPVCLLVILIGFAVGFQVNTVFPLSITGPAILQLILISALSFQNVADKDYKHAFLAASTISGIVHASLYLDRILLPYYTGWDALFSSRFSGECLSCVCRQKELVMGGEIVRYRSWSVTTMSVVAVIFLRALCEIYGKKIGKILMGITSLVENLGWILITIDSVYLMMKTPPERAVLRIAAFGCIFVLVCLHFLKILSSHMYRMSCSAENKKNMSTHVIGQKK